jgi:CelD/BcsL family acetyltransferase involved in cellulose biosynthesis
VNEGRRTNTLTMASQGDHTTSGARQPPSRVLRTPDELNGLVEEWRELAAASNVSSFATQDWVMSWWESIGRGMDAEVAVWTSSDGALEALVALRPARERVHERVPWTFPTWTNLGGGPGSADHCGWPVLSARIYDVRAWIESKSRDATLILRNLDAATGVGFVPAGAHLISRTPCPRLSIPPPDKPLGRSRKSRNRIKHFTRALREAGVTFRWVPPEEMSDSDLDDFFDLNRRRQAMMGRQSTFVPERQQLHRRLVNRSGPGRGPAIVRAEHQGRVIGVRYGFLWQETFAAFHTGWDPDWASSRLGTVLDTECIRLAGAAGARVFDLLRGAEEYKYRLGGEDRFDETWLIPAGLPARLYGLKYRLKARLARRREEGAPLRTTPSEA